MRCNAFKHLDLPPRQLSPCHAKVHPLSSSWLNRTHEGFEHRNLSYKILKSHLRMQSWASLGYDA